MIYKKTWKYILIHAYGPFFRPKALKSFGDVEEGDISKGFMRGYYNLSQFGDCWVYGHSIIEDNAQISENAKVFSAIVCGNSLISGNAQIMKGAEVRGNSKISGNTIIPNNTVVVDYDI